MSVVFEGLGCRQLVAIPRRMDPPPSAGVPSTGLHDRMLSPSNRSRNGRTYRVILRASLVYVPYHRTYLVGYGHYLPLATTAV